MLSGIDEYLPGYKDRSAVLASEHAPKVVPGNNGVFLPMIVVSGQVVGTWQRRRERNALTIPLKPFQPLGEIQENVTLAAKRYSDFLGYPFSPTTIQGTA